MRSLFLRIFLWFWGAMVAVALLLVLSSPFFTSSRPRLERWQRSSARLLEARLDFVARRVEHGQAVPRTSERTHLGHRGDVYLLTVDGRSLEGAAPTPEIAAFGRRVATAGEEIAVRQGTLHLVGRPVARPQGGPAVVVLAVRRPPNLVDLLELRHLGWRLALVTLLVGLLCLALAHQLSAPLTTLQKAIRQLAAGDLSARTDRRLAERHDDVGALARDVDTMAARLEALVSAEKRLVRDVSHELRSPLARLGVALELARERAGTAAAEPLSRIELESTRLADLVQQLLTLSRLESAFGVANPETVDLAVLVTEVAEDAAYEAKPRGVEVTVEAPTSCPAAGDPLEMRSALENVLRNAVAFSSAGSSVQVLVENTDGHVVVRVRDAGPGVPEAHLQALFTPFFRVDEARDRRQGGSGLGLAIVAAIVRQHGGSVSARNLPQGGLEVELRVPGPAGARAHHPATIGSP